jgi:phosphate transport system protein
MRRHFEEQLAECNSRLVHMGAVAQRMIDESIQCLLDRDAEGHQRVFKDEEEMNGLHIEIDERVISALALQQPVATDLRLLIMASKIAGELERIGDQAVNICQNTASLLQHPPVEISTNMPAMADLVREMLRESLEAFLCRDVELAQKVLHTDDKVDDFKDQVFFQLLGHMMSEPPAIPRAVALILISRSLERVADHATNIAEEVIYAAQGRDVRHHREEERRREGSAGGEAGIKAPHDPYLS